MSLMDYAGHDIPWSPGEGEFSPEGYVAALSPEQLWSIIEFGANVPDGEMRALITQAAQARLNQLQPASTPTENGMATDGGQLAPAVTPAETTNEHASNEPQWGSGQVQGLYDQLFGREGSGEAVDWWANHANTSGWNQGTLIDAMLNEGDGQETFTDYVYDQGYRDRPSGVPADNSVANPVTNPITNPVTVPETGTMPEAPVYQAPTAPAGQFQLPDYGQPVMRDRLPFTAQPPSIRQPGVQMNNMNNAARGGLLDEEQRRAMGLL